MAEPDPAVDPLPVPHPDVVARQVGDDVVLVHLDTSQIFALNATGARFWELLSDGKSRVEIEETIESEYDVSRDEVKASIDALLADLLAESIVQGRGG